MIKLISVRKLSPAELALKEIMQCLNEILKDHKKGEKHEGR